MLQTEKTRGQNAVLPNVGIKPLKGVITKRLQNEIIKNPPIATKVTPLAEPILNRAIAVAARAEAPDPLAVAVGLLQGLPHREADKETRERHPTLLIKIKRTT